MPSVEEEIAKLRERVEAGERRAEEQRRVALRARVINALVNAGADKKAAELGVTSLLANDLFVGKDGSVTWANGSNLEDGVAAYIAREPSGFFKPRETSSTTEAAPTLADAAAAFPWGASEANVDAFKKSVEKGKTEGAKKTADGTVDWNDLASRMKVGRAL